MDHSPSYVKNLVRKFSAASRPTDENQQDQKPSTLAAAPGYQPTAAPATLSAPARSSVSGSRSKLRSPTISAVGRSGDEHQQASTSTKQQEETSSSVVLTKADHTTEPDNPQKQEEVVTDIPAASSITKSSGLQEIFHISSGKRDVKNLVKKFSVASPPTDESHQDQKPATSAAAPGYQPTAGDVFRLTDCIQMHKDKPLNKSRTIFHGEQISNVIPAQKLVIKFIPHDEKNKQEAKLLLKLKRHPNVVFFIHSDVCRQGPMTFIYIAMELCHEQNLHDHVTENVKNNVPFDSQLSISQAKQLVEGLNFIHENDIIHRDLKPHNVLFSLDKKTIKIADFGISKPMTSGRTVIIVTNARAGTDGYRAPETYNSNEISKQADIFSLGLIFYFLWSNGLHAFGDEPDIWNYNIKKNQKRDLSQLLLGNQEMAMNVLQWSLQFNRKDRPKAAQILNHKIFGGTEIPQKLFYCKTITDHNTDTAMDQHQTSSVKDLARKFSAAGLLTDKIHQDQKPSTSAAAPGNQPTAKGDQTDLWSRCDVM